MTRRWKHDGRIIEASSSPTFRGHVHVSDLLLLCCCFHPYMVFSLTVGDHLSAVVISKQALDIHSYFPPTHKYGQLTFPYLHFIQFNTTCSLLLNILPIINTLYGGTIMPTCLVCIPITQILSMHASFSLCSFQSQI